MRAPWLVLRILAALLALSLPRVLPVPSRRLVPAVPRVLPVPSRPPALRSCQSVPVLMLPRVLGLTLSRDVTRVHQLPGVPLCQLMVS